MVLTYATYVCWLVAVPDITMGHEAHQKVRSTPFRLLNQAIRAKHRQLVNYTTEALSEDEGLQVLNNLLPLGVVRIWETTKRSGVRQETILSRDAIVGEAGNCVEHVAGLRRCTGDRTIRDGGDRRHLILWLRVY